jgi:hypothetical protein
MLMKECLANALEAELSGPLARGLSEEVRINYIDPGGGKGRNGG